MKIVIEVPDETGEIIVDCYDDDEYQIAWKIIDSKDFEIIEGNKKNSRNGSYYVF